MIRLASLCVLAALLACGLVTCPGVGRTYSGTMAVWAMKDNDYIAKNFAGTVAGLQAAFVYLGGGTNGGTLTLGPGTLALGADSLLWNYDRTLLLRGAGLRGTKLTKTGSRPALVLGDNDGDHAGATEGYDGNGDLVTVQDIWFSGPGKTGTGSRAIVDWDSGSNIFERVTISTFSVGYQGIGADVVTFRDCLFSLDSIGVALYSRCDQNTFSSCYWTENQIGLLVENTLGGRVYGSNFVFSDSADVVFDNPATPSQGGDERGVQGWLLNSCWFESSSTALPRHIRVGRSGTSTRLSQGITVDGVVWYATNSTNFLQADAGTMIELRNLRHQGASSTLVMNTSVSGLTQSVMIRDDASMLPSNITLFNGTNAASWIERGRGSTRSAAFATPYTPVGNSQQIVELGALTSNLTINEPSTPVRGFRLTIRLIQDGTGGRTVTWNAVFKNAWSDAGNTANKRSVITHYFDGTNWLQESYSAWY